MSNYQYLMYSEVSKTEENKKNELKKIIDLNEEIKKLRLLSKIREYIKNKYDITTSVKDFRICNGGYLSIEDGKEVYTLNLKFDNQIVTYSFQKERR